MGRWGKVAAAVATLVVMASSGVTLLGRVDASSPSAGEWPKPAKVALLGDETLGVNASAYRQQLAGRGVAVVASSASTGRLLGYGWRCIVRRAGRLVEIVATSAVNASCRAEGLQEIAGWAGAGRLGDAVVIGTGLADARSGTGTKAALDEVRRLVAERPVYLVTVAVRAGASISPTAYNRAASQWCAADSRCRMIPWDTSAAARRSATYAAGGTSLTATGALERARYIAGIVAAAPMPPAATTTTTTTTSTTSTTTTTTVPPTVPSTPPTSPPPPDPGVLTEPGDPPYFTDGVGAFRLVCPYSHSNDDDPLVKPGQPGAAHHHAFFGNRSTNAFSTTESLLAGTTTCPGGTANRSAYWVPAMMTPTGETTPSEAIVYYKSGYGGVAPKAVTPMPAGLRMLVGEPMRTQEDLRPSWERHVFWWCMHVPSGNYTQKTKEMQACSAGWDVVMTVEFPQCWDGVHLDAADHMSHMAYPDGGCPASHPVPIPAITVNAYWPVATSTAGWHLASDHYTGPAGRSGHADWWNGWDPGTVAIWMRECVNAGLDCAAYNLGDGRRLASTPQ